MPELSCVLQVNTYGGGLTSICTAFHDLIRKCTCIKDFMQSLLQGNFFHLILVTKKHEVFIDKLFCSFLLQWHLSRELLRPNTYNFLTSFGVTHRRDTHHWSCAQIMLWSSYKVNFLSNTFLKKVSPQKI